MEAKKKTLWETEKGKREIGKKKKERKMEIELYAWYEGLFFAILPWEVVMCCSVQAKKKTFTFR